MSFSSESSFGFGRLYQVPPSFIRCSDLVYLLYEGPVLHLPFERYLPFAEYLYPLRVVFSNEWTQEVDVWTATSPTD